MAEHLVHVHPLVGVLLQQVLNKHLCLLLHCDAGGEDQFGKLGLCLFVTSYVYNVLLEGGFAEEELIGQYPQTPRIDLLAISLIAQLLRRRVLKAPHNSRP
jgi:hypothetical protein